MKHQKIIVAFVAMVSLVVLFHLAVILKLIPYDIAWGGRLKNDMEMYIFESISILINLFLIFNLLIKGKFIKSLLKSKTINTVLWVFLVLFVLNTIGNLFAQTNFEKAFSFVTLIFAVLIGLILRTPQLDNNSKK